MKILSFRVSELCEIGMRSRKIIVFQLSEIGLLVKFEFQGLWIMQFQLLDS